MASQIIINFRDIDAEKFDKIKKAIKTLLRFEEKCGIYSMSASELVKED